MSMLPSERTIRLRRLAARRCEENQGLFLVSSQWDDGSWIHTHFANPVTALDTYLDWMHRGAVTVMFVRKQ